MNKTAQASWSPFILVNITDKMHLQTVLARSDCMIMHLSCLQYEVLSVKNRGITGYHPVHCRQV